MISARVPEQLRVERPGVGSPGPHQNGILETIYPMEGGSRTSSTEAEGDDEGLASVAPAAPSHRGDLPETLSDRVEAEERPFRRAADTRLQSVLLVEDNEGDAMLLLEHLAETRIVATHVSRVADAERALRDQVFDFVISDLLLPDAHGLDSIRRLAPLAGDTPIIILTGLDDEELALQAVKQGAQDYLVKGQVDPPLLRRTLRHALERKRVFNHLLYVTRHDALTGAVNRVTLREEIEATLTRARCRGLTFAILYIDLDRFKAINDTLGHAAGDAVLREVALRLRQSVGANDMVARLGGDEFAVLLQELDHRLSAIDLAERIRVALERPIAIAGRDLVITASIGLTCYPDISSSADELLKAADAAMYQAKRRGRNNVLVSGAVPDEHLAQEALVNDLQHALEREEFSLHFQPQLTVAGRRVVAFEALLRWNRRGGEAVPPSEFIPLLEESGRIVAVGEWVIEQACWQLDRWRSAGWVDLRVAVNLSAQQLERAGLIDCVRDCLTRFALPSRCLELEITETMLVTDAAHLSTTITDLRALGVRIAIEDFGTGFSSLAHLSQFEVDCLKIDRSFIHQIDAGGDRAMIVSALVTLGHNLGLEVVAEGVETPAQLAMLATSRCDLMQGYLLGRPDVASAFRNGQRWPSGPGDGGTTTRIRRVQGPK